MSTIPLVGWICPACDHTSTACPLPGIRDLAAILLALASLVGALGGLVKVARDQGKDQAFAWDAYGDQVAEVERLKERVARVEGACKVEVKP